MGASRVLCVPSTMRRKDLLHCGPYGSLVLGPYGSLAWRCDTPAPRPALSCPTPGPLPAHFFLKQGSYRIGAMRGEVLDDVFALKLGGERERRLLLVVGLVSAFMSRRPANSVRVGGRRVRKWKGPLTISDCYIANAELTSSG